MYVNGTVVNMNLKAKRLLHSAEDGWSRLFQEIEDRTDDTVVGAFGVRQEYYQEKTNAVELGFK